MEKSDLEQKLKEYIGRKEIMVAELNGMVGAIKALEMLIQDWDKPINLKEKEHGNNRITN